MAIFIALAMTGFRLQYFLKLFGSNRFGHSKNLKIEKFLICMSRTNNKVDFDDNLEKVLNTSSSEEDIIAEYIEAEIITEECEERYKGLGSYDTDEQANFIMTAISEYLSESPCCTKDCCAMWKDEEIQKHLHDMESLSKTEKKLVVLTVLRNCAINSENTRYSKKRQRLRFSFR